MKKPSIIILLLVAGLITQAQSSAIQGRWERRGVDEVGLFVVNNGRLEKLETQEITGSNKDFAFTFTPKQAGFFAVGFGPELAPTGKHLFYFKPGDNLNLIVNDSSYTLVGENTKENIALTAWNDYILQVQLNALYATRMSYVGFFPLLDEKWKGMANAQLIASFQTGNKAFDETFARFRQYDLLSYATSFVTKPGAPRGENFSDFYREMNIGNLTETLDIIEYPYAFRMLNGVDYVENLLAGKRGGNRLQLIESAKNDALKGELFLLLLPVSVRDAATAETWTEQFEKYLTTAEQKARLQEILTRIQQMPEQAQTNRSQTERTALVVGEPAPNFTANDVNGNPVSLSDFKGKVVYIDFWATWCGPCRQEIPHLKALKEKYKDNKDLVIIGISTDKMSDNQKWIDFVAEHELGGIQVNSPTDAEVTAGKLYGIRFLPTFILIDKNGIVVSNNAPRASSDQIVPMLDGLLK
jgi:thiol-disulfide isomerase/thioredoxin